MLYATDSGADMRKTLAAVFMGGLITSTLLTLIVLPTLYCSVADMTRHRMFAKILTMILIIP